MKLVRCDRCGQEEGVDFLAKTGKVLFTPPHSARARRPTMDKSLSRDLCPGCLDALVKSFTDLFTAEFVAPRKVADRG